ncbi:MAG TPA: L,D-transpeptidase family protein [Firmicutes bacterium]|nr:L,D-transpeptidase family protein [Bacillota bacterium]
MRSESRVILFLVLFILLPCLAVRGAGREPSCQCQGQPLLVKTIPPMRGKAVLALQERLSQLGYYRKEADGLYGPATVQAVEKLQADLGLPVTGNMDPATWAHLAWVEEKAVVEQPLPPPQGEISILVDTDALILIVYADGEPYKIYPVAVGKWTTPTPLGEWQINSMSSVWEGPFGARWLGLSCPFGNYGIHGTDNPASIGWEVSSGCIRMYNHDVIELFDWVAPGTPVTIIGSRIKSIPIPPRLGPGDVGQAVVPLQWRLRELGQDVGRADGVYGKATEGAVRELQYFYGLPPSGIADRNLLFLLGLGKGGEDR